MATDNEQAYSLFPNDRPAGQTAAPSEPAIFSPTLTPTWAVKAPAAHAPATAGETAPEQADDAAEKLFSTERHADADTELASSVEKLDGLADAVRMAGNAQRADMLAEAGTMLIDDARQHGTSAGDLSEIVGMIHEASSTLSEMTADQLSDGRARGLRELANDGVLESDLDLARGLIQKMGEKIPDLNFQLEATGLGNDVRFIKALVKEAKRRGGQ